MSGDVQPRKRNKDKKRRRDDEETRPSGVNVTKMGPDDIQLHVHSDHGTGGHWCAKIFFFSLMAILLGLIGLILLENRGLADLDTPLSESRFADVLEGWVDEKREAHDEHDHHPIGDHDDNDEHDHDQEHDDDEHDDEHDEDEDEENHSEKDVDDEDDNEKDEGFEESGEVEDTNDDENDDDDDNEIEGDERSNLTNNNQQKLTSTLNVQNLNRSPPSNINQKQFEGMNNNEPIKPHVTVRQLKRQVDDLVDNYNKLATTLNRPPLDETNIASENSQKRVDDEEDGIEADLKDEDDESQENDESNDDNLATEEDDDDEEVQNVEESIDDTDDTPDDDNNDIKSELVDDDENEIEQQDETQPTEEDTDGESSSQIDRSGPASAPNDDTLLEEELRRANERLAEDPQIALTSFEQILKNHPTSSSAQFGLAKALDRLADLNRSNTILKRAIAEYEKYIALDKKLNDTEFKAAAERCIERMRFIGDHLKAVSLHEKLIERFDDSPYYRNQLAISYLLVNRLADAKYVLHTTLQRWREDGFAAAHYGYVLKNLDQNLEAAVIFLRQGIESGAKGTDDGRLYFNLGDALIRLGRTDEAKEVFKEAANKNLFPSEYQRSLYNVDHLKAQPFWTLAETGYKHEFRALEQNWEKIRDEGLNILDKNGYFVDEAESLRDKGIWKQVELFARGKRNARNCEKTPFTCKLIETFPAARFCKRGQVKFSIMHPNTHVWPHCGPTNCRLRAHLALKTADHTSIRVATETRTWVEGKIMIFDDSFEHEVWHNGTTFRLILIVDVWHPDLTIEEKKTLVPI